VLFVLLFLSSRMLIKLVSMFVQTRKNVAEIDRLCALVVYIG
jgi:hypothetical protein